MAGTAVTPRKANAPARKSMGGWKMWVSCLLLGVGFGVFMHFLLKW